MQEEYAIRAFSRSSLCDSPLYDGSSGGMTVFQADGWVVISACPASGGVLSVRTESTQRCARNQGFLISFPVGKYVFGRTRPEFRIDSAAAGKKYAAEGKTSHTKTKPPSCLKNRGSGGRTLVIPFYPP